MRLGVFGGTFDPLHLGHLIMAAEACEQLELDRLLWVLTPCPPHKQGQPITPVSQRLDMLQAVLDLNPWFELSRIDIDRPPPHYAADTVRLLCAENPGSELTYLLGSDSLRDLPGWHRPRRFVAACDRIGVVRRPGVEFDLPALEQQLPGIQEKIEFVEAPLIQISSSEIRQRIAAGRTYRYFLPEPVYRIIREQDLYRE